jgi:hypothetical protein
MPANHCMATKRDGHVCLALLRQGEFRCGRHKPSYDTLGARVFAYNEIRYRCHRMYAVMRVIDIDPVRRVVLQRKIDEWRRIAVRTFELMADERIEAVLNQHEREWYLLNIPEPINREGQIVIDLAAVPDPQPRRAVNRQRLIVQAPVLNRPRRGLEPRELHNFAADNQNVHRAETVRMVTSVVEKVLKIEVPKAYRWNTRVISKTPGEIIANCKLTVSAGMAMMGKYSKADDIYELGRGIYGRVLDSVWQFISKSDDKECLCAILRAELQDNIGMCMQGNLSRLCNVLAGYIDEIKITETPSERLGREFPKLLEIEDVSERLTKAKSILLEVGLPTAEWSAWTDALII